MTREWRRLTEGGVSRKGGRRRTIGMKWTVVIVDAWLCRKESEWKSLLSRWEAGLCSACRQNGLWWNCEPIRGNFITSSHNDIQGGRNGRHLQIETVHSLLSFTSTVCSVESPVFSIFVSVTPTPTPPAPYPCSCRSLIHILFVFPRWPSLLIIAWRFHSFSLLSHSISYSHISLSSGWTPIFHPLGPPPFVKII